MDSVDSKDLEDMQEMQMIASLSWHTDDPITWQSEVIGVWKNMVQATATFNQTHLNQLIMVRDHFLELFEYLADQPDTFLMPFSWSLEKKISTTLFRHVK